MSTKSTGPFEGGAAPLSKIGDSGKGAQESNG